MATKAETIAEMAIKSIRMLARMSRNPAIVRKGHGMIRAINEELEAKPKREKKPKEDEIVIDV